MASELRSPHALHVLAQMSLDDNCVGGVELQSQAASLETSSLASLRRQMPEYLTATGFSRCVTTCIVIERRICTKIDSDCCNERTVDIPCELI